MFWDRYKIVELTGSTVLLYQVAESKHVYKSIKSAMKEPIWWDNLSNEYMVTKNNVTDVEWLQPYLKKSVKSLIIRHHGYQVEALLIMKVKCK